MDTIIITFTLTDLTDERYREVCADLAPAFAELPGLLAKVWLTDPDAGRFGGVAKAWHSGPGGARYGGFYLFADAADADAFLASALCRTVRSYPHFTDIVVQRYTVDETTTRRTQPGVALVASSAVPA